MAEKKPENRIWTPYFRVSFPSVFVARSFEDGKEPVFELDAIWPAGTDLSELKNAVANCAAAKFGGLDAVKELINAGKFKNPFHDGADKDYEGYDEGTTYATLRGRQKPGIVAADGKTLILTADEFYGGCWARASVVPYSFDNKGKGVGLGLRNLQKVKDDTSFAGGISAADEFDAIDEYQPPAGDDGAAAIF